MTTGMNAAVYQSANDETPPRADVAGPETAPGDMVAGGRRAG
jgi:hypothetical protein